MQFVKVLLSEKVRIPCYKNMIFLLIIKRMLVLPEKNNPDPPKNEGTWIITPKIIAPLLLFPEFLDLG